MKQFGYQHLALLTIAVFPLILMGGCPIDPTLGGVLPAEAGTYWVEYSDSALVVYELPATRDEVGAWHTFEMAQPDWYTGPALYEVHEDGSWDRLTTDETLTLDDVLQTYDPAPSID